MDRWACTACGASWAPGAPCCPECRGLDHAEEGEESMPKISSSGTVSYEPGREPGGGEGQVHPGTGEPAMAVEHPADGTLSPPLSSEPADDSGDAGLAEPEHIVESTAPEPSASGPDDPPGAAAADVPGAGPAGDGPPQPRAGT